MLNAAEPLELRVSAFWGGRQIILKARLQVAAQRTAIDFHVVLNTKPFVPSEQLLFLLPILIYVVGIFYYLKLGE